MDRFELTTMFFTMLSDASAKVKRLKHETEQAEFDLRDLIDAAYREDLTVTQIAKAAEISRDKVYRYFTMPPPANYVERVRDSRTLEEMLEEYNNSSSTADEVSEQESTRSEDQR